MARLRDLQGRALQRSYASVIDINSYPETGAQLHGFTLKQKKHVPELHLTALQLEHDKTGAEYLHVAREDKNNVFAINFKTNPVDRTGLPHILEHVTLCGSVNYPVRDPFFKMMPRSLANFMNAFTSSDYTSYPFATTNEQDFRNLASVYLDATLHPLLKKTDFLQEGWRLGPENPREAATEENTIFKGVVYNEMKGQMSDASYLYYIRFREHIIPALENSGGDPEKMTDLTYNKLVKFSREHYHPSNAKIFTYGNLPLDDHLQQVDKALSKFTKASRDKSLKVPIDMKNQALSYEVPGPIDTMQPPDRQIKSSVSWLGCDSTDIIENFSLSIMLSLLMSGYGSPLYQGLIESGLGTNFSPNTGYDSSAKTSVISIGLDGMKAEDVPQLTKRIRSLLAERASEAFQPHKIEGYMHQLEIALKHKTAGFGMGLLDKTLPGWFNGSSPMDGLAWNDIIDAFKARLAKGSLFESLVKKYLLNDNCMQFTMLPSETYNADLDAQEQKRRATILAQETELAGSAEEAFAKLGRQEAELLKDQEEAQHNNIETLPTLRVKDIPTEKETKPVRWGTVGSSQVLWREADTNGITYFQAKHLFEGLPDELRLLMPLFTESLMRLGTKTMPVGDLEAEILLKTGGISVSPFVSGSPFNTTDYTEGLTFDGYALDRNVPAMFDLLKSLLLEVDFSAPNAAPAIIELLESKTSGALDAVAETGHHFAAISAAAALSARGRLREQLAGLSQIEATARLLRSAKEDPRHLQEVIEKLKLIQAIAVSNSSKLSMRVVCEGSSVSANEALLGKFLNTLPNASAARTTNFSAEQMRGTSLSRNTFFNMPFQVSYSGTCLQTTSFGSEDKAPLVILSQLLTHNFLLPEVREKGGAYGASASTGPSQSIFAMTSYRDPNPRNTLATYNKAGRFAADRDWTAREMEESKLSLFQGIDAPTSVSGDGSKEFMTGITQDMDQDMRQRLLSATKNDVQRVAQKYLVDAKEDSVSTAILGEKKTWVEESEKWQVKGLNISA